MILNKVNGFNYYKYKNYILECITQILCEDVARIIIHFLGIIYYEELDELRKFRSKKHTIILSIGLRHSSFGIKFSGARNDKVGEQKMFGIFISEIKKDSCAEEYMRLNRKDFRGFEVYKYGNLNLSDGMGTLKKLKEYQKFNMNSGMILKLRWNPKLLEKYNYEIIKKK